MTTTKAARSQPYHHGDLRNALVRAGVTLAREHGPEAIVLREAARRVGVSANAAYRHFDALPALVEAVRHESLAALAVAMRTEIDQLELTGDPAADAVLNLTAVGRGYVHFALAEPGLFATAFSREKHQPGPGDTEPAADSPWRLLGRALDEMVEVGLLARPKREAAATYAWSVVHGLSILLLGPMAAVPAAEREPTITATLDLVLRGLRSP